MTVTVCAFLVFGMGVNMYGLSSRYFTTEYIYVLNYGEIDLRIHDLQTVVSLQRIMFLTLLPSRCCSSMILLEETPCNMEITR